MSLTADQKLQRVGEEVVDYATQAGKLDCGFQVESAGLLVLQRAYAIAIAKAVHFQGAALDAGRTQFAIETLREQLENDVKLQVVLRGGRVN